MWTLSSHHAPFAVVCETILEKTETFIEITDLSWPETQAIHFLKRNVCEKPAYTIKYSPYKVTVLTIALRDLAVSTS